jgi:hypothetical protein
MKNPLDFSLFLSRKTRSANKGFALLRINCKVDVFLSQEILYLQHENVHKARNSRKAPNVGRNFAAETKKNQNMKRIILSSYLLNDYNLFPTLMRM